MMSHGPVTEASASANLHTVAPSHRHAELCVPPPPLRHTTDTYDFKLLKKARGKQSKTRADQWAIAAVQCASEWASKHQHLVHLSIAFAQVYAPCM